MSYAFRWNNYSHPNLRAAFDMGTLTTDPTSTMKNLARTGSAFDSVITNGYIPMSPLIHTKKTPCMDFRSTQYITIPNPILGMNPFSFVAWFNCNTMVGGDVMLSLALNDGEIWLIPTVDRSVDIYMGALRAWPRPKLPVGETHMLAFSLSPTQSMVFVDGHLLDLQGGDAGVYNSANIYLGRPFGAGSRLDARLDNVMFWNIALNQHQAYSLWRSSVPR